MKAYFTLLGVLLSLIISAQNYPSATEAIQNADTEGQGYQSFDIFQSSSNTLNPALRNIATDIQPIEVDQATLNEIMEDKPEFISFPLVHQADTLSVKLQRHQVLTEDFKVRDQDGQELQYTPGIYYRGIIDDVPGSKAVFSFFEESVNGMVSTRAEGNRTIAQLKGQQQYVIYSDDEMTVQQDFTCQVNSIDQPYDIPPQSIDQTTNSTTANCVRVMYELTNDIYQNNGSSVNTTTNWITSVHNIVSTLYSDNNIPTALSDVLIWQQTDPYTGSNGEKLAFFRDNRNAVNGDVAHLLDTPSSGGVAYLNTLCQQSRYAYSGVSMNYQQLPTYSWTINVVAHEMGHSLGSPHTHACFWNNNGTAIDSCGPDNGYSEGCDNGPTPTNGGTVMSYCHLDPNVGVNLALGFHPQVGGYLDSNISTKSCLGTDCINSCMQTIAGINVDQNDLNSLTINIDDVLSDSWDYRIFQANTAPGNLITTSNNSININNIQPATYYVIQVANNCSNGNYGGARQLLYLSEADWCSGTLFTDTGGINGDYANDENIVKTFYPNQSNQKLTLSLDEFDTENNSDLMTIYDGESTDAPVFTNGEDLSGGFVPPFTFSATNPTGAITIEFTADGSVNAPGWEISFTCETFSTSSFSENDIKIYPNPFNNKVNITSDKDIEKLIVYDMNGKIVRQLQLNDNNNLIDLDLSGMSSGIYLIKLSNGISSFTKRVIKQ